MNRCWVQAVFRSSVNVQAASTPIGIKRHSEEIMNIKTQESLNESATDLASMGNSEVDISDGVALDMFGVSSSMDNEMYMHGACFEIRVLSKEYQHTCKSTGLMLWESARLMASVLAQNPGIVSGKQVLELGCSCSGICSMVAARTANIVVATDGDTNALDLLTLNASSNLTRQLLDKLVVKQLEWGNSSLIEAIKKVSSQDGFDVIIDTDVTYFPDAVSPLFSTARQLISARRCSDEDSREPAALILCHVLCRVGEVSVISAASRFGFALVDWWPPESPSHGIISSWFTGHDKDEDTISTAFSITYFGSVH